MPARRKRPWQGQPPPGTAIDWGDHLAEGLIGAWRFAEGAGQLAADAAQNNLATFTGAPTWVAGNPGRAFSLNGTTQYATAPFKARYNNTSLGVSVWIKPYSFSNYQTVVGRWNETGNQRVWALIIFAGSPVYLYSSADGVNGNTANTAALLTANRWVHIVGTQSANSCAIYINGLVAASGTGRPMTTTPTTPLYIGYSPVFAGAAAYFNGAIRNVLMYNRLLSAGDAKALYAEPWRPFAAPRLRGMPAAAGSAGGGTAQTRVMVLA